MTDPTGKVATNACAYLERIKAIVEESKQEIDYINMEYEELGEYAGEFPAPKFMVKFKCTK